MRIRNASVLLGVLAGFAAVSTAAPVSASAASAPRSITPPTEVPGDPTVWLCFPGSANDPCAGNLIYTSISPHGTRSVVHAAASSDPPIDCFYVYPTVSTQPTPNANLHIDPAETNVALLQAARFSEDCRVYAPMYRQATIAAIFDGEKGVNAVELYEDVLSAWSYYLAHYNDGRGVVLIGHSQGSFVLESLIKLEIETHPDQLSKIVSAILLGGNVNVPSSQPATTGSSPSSGPALGTTPLQGATFSSISPCRSSSQTGCLIAYSSFDATPPADSLFGRTSVPGEEVLCTNPADPAAPVGKAVPIQPYLPLDDITLFGGTSAAGVTTPWVSYPGRFTAACEYADGASWLQINGPTSPSAGSPYLTTALGPTWGLHLVDPNIAMGNLVSLVHSEAVSWVKHHHTS